MTYEEALAALTECEECDCCLLCSKVDEAHLLARSALSAVSNIVHCEDCVHFVPEIEGRYDWGWCKSCRCKKHPYGFCDEGRRKEQRDEQNRDA